MSEKPEAGDLYAVKCRDGAFALGERHPGWASFRSDAIGWVLLERAKPKTLAEEARELTRRSPIEIGDVLPAKVKEWIDHSTDLLRRIA